MIPAKTSPQGRKRILFLIPSLLGGGAEHVLLNMLSIFNYEKYEVDICIGVKRTNYLKDIPQQVGVSYLFSNVVFEKIVIFLQRSLNSHRLVKMIINNRIKGNYDTGISFIDSYYTDFLLKLNGKIKKNIAWVHASINSNKNYSKFYRGMYKKRIIADRYKKLDRIVFVSNESRSEFQQVFGEFANSDVIYNVLNVDSIRLRALSEIPSFAGNGTVNILAVGSLIPVKAFHRLIGAASLLKNDGLNFRIRILGTGYLHKRLLRLIVSLGVEQNVKLLGFKSNPYAFMKASDIFVMTSVSEALPTALCEAMVIGLPCIVTDCSGCREITGNGEFGLITGMSELDIFNGLKKLISDKELRKEYKEKAAVRSLIFNDGMALKKVYSIL